MLGPTRKGSDEKICEVNVGRINYGESETVREKLRGLREDPQKTCSIFFGV